MNSAGMCLGWEGDLHADLPLGTPGSGDVGLVRRRATRRMLLMIDYLITGITMVFNESFTVVPQNLQEKY